jgi:hypothetical protein
VGVPHHPLLPLKGPNRIAGVDAVTRKGYNITGYFNVTLQSRDRSVI